MVEIIDKRKVTGKTVAICDIPIGTYFYGSIGNYLCLTPTSTKLFVLAYGCMVDLDNPDNTFSVDGCVVSNYQPVKVRIAVVENE